MFKWKPSKTQRTEFALKMREIEDFCKKNDIYKSISGDSYYFYINGVKYRVSNHTIEASNRKAFNDFGEQIRELYHDEYDDCVCYTAGKTRIIDIYNDLKNGYSLDKRGNRIG